MKNISASVKDKLLHLARQSGKPFQFLLIQYGFERFLYRLSQSSFKETFILKGGLLLTGMGIPQTRTTRDIDFLGLRMKDFYDIWMLSRAHSFHGLSLQEAITATCRRRKTALSSKTEVFAKEFAGLAGKQTQWAAFLKKANFSDIPEDFSTIMEKIRTFLHPVINTIEKDARFNKYWPPGGPWQEAL